jgi:hypothetical protein
VLRGLREGGEPAGLAAGGSHERLAVERLAVRRLAVGELPFPLNPNCAAVANVAGVRDGAPAARSGLMPHPERHIDPTHHPRWTRPPEAGGWRTDSNCFRTRSSISLNGAAAAMAQTLKQRLEEGGNDLNVRDRPGGCIRGV